LGPGLGSRLGLALAVGTVVEHVEEGDEELGRAPGAERGALHLHAQHAHVHVHAHVRVGLGWG